MLQELYFVATKEGKTKTLKEAKKCFYEHERVDAPQVAAKRWRAIKLQHDGREIRLRDWRDFRGQYTLFRRNVEDWNEGDEQARLLSMLPQAWIKRVTKEEAKRAKFNHTFNRGMHDHMTLHAHSNPLLSHSRPSDAFERSGGFRFVLRQGKN